MLCDAVDFTNFFPKMQDIVEIPYFPQYTVLLISRNIFEFES